MCLVVLTLYPCNHTVLTECTPCAAGMHPQICNPATIDSKVIPYKHGQKPLRCPCSKHGRACFVPPTDPEKFGEFCVQNNLAFEDVVAIMPAWIFDMNGTKIGTRSTPYRATDYIVGYYQAKNPRATQSLATQTRSAKVPNRKRKFEGNSPPTKRFKIDSNQPVKTPVPGEKAETAEGDDMMGMGRVLTPMDTRIKHES